MESGVAVLLASWRLASWKGGKEAVPDSSCSGLPCEPVGQVQGHKQVATHMRGSSHIIKALTPVSPASQGAEAIVQSPAWGLLAQCSVALGHSLALQASLSPARRRGIRLERANAASDSIRQP